MKSTILAASVMASLGSTAFADEKRPSVLQIPDLCSAVQVGNQTILSCVNTSVLPKRTDYTSTGKIETETTGDTVRLILDWIPNEIPKGEFIGSDSDGDGVEDTQIGHDIDGTYYIDTQGVYGVINQTYDCVRSISGPSEALICKTGVQIPDVSTYECFTGLQDTGSVRLDDGVPIPYSEDYTLCIRENIEA